MDTIHENAIRKIIKGVKEGEKQNDVLNPVVKNQAGVRRTKFKLATAGNS